MDLENKSHQAVARLTSGCKKFKKLTVSRHYFKLARSYVLALAKRHLAVKIVKPSHAGRIISIMQLVFFVTGTRISTLSPFVANSERFCDIFENVGKRGTFVHSSNSCIFCGKASIWQFWHVQVWSSALVWEGLQFWSWAFQTLNYSLCVAGATLRMNRVDVFSWQAQYFFCCHGHEKSPNPMVCFNLKQVWH